MRWQAGPEWEDAFTFRVSCRLNCGVNIGAPGLAYSLRSVPVGADGASNFRLNFRLGITRLSQLFRRGPLWRSPSLGWCCYYLCVIAGVLAQEKEAGPAARGLKQLRGVSSCFSLRVEVEAPKLRCCKFKFSSAAGPPQALLSRPLAAAGSGCGGPRVADVRPGVVGRTRTGPPCQRLRCHSARSAPTQPRQPWLAR